MGRIKGLLLLRALFPLIYLADKVVQAKGSASGNISTVDIYVSAIDAVTLLGNAIYEFSKKKWASLLNSTLKRCN